MPKNRILFVLATYLNLTLYVGGTTKEPIQKWQLQLKELEKEQQALNQKEAPQIQGLWTVERTEILSTNKEVQLLIIELKKALLESKITLAHTQKELAKLIQTLTHFIYFVSTIVFILSLAYLIKQIP